MSLPYFTHMRHNVTLKVNPLVWWAKISSQLPEWSHACQLILLYQPTSAAAERVFSLLRQSIDDQQTAS